MLVENRPTFNVSIVRLKTTDLDRTVPAVGGWASTSAACATSSIATGASPYRPIVVIENATLAQVAATRRRLDYELPDVVVQQVPTREYLKISSARTSSATSGEASDQQVDAIRR